MFSKVIVLLAALYAQTVYSRAYNSPSVHLFTPTHPSHGRSYESSHDGHLGGDLMYQGPTAIPHVLHDGHIADTSEVAAAKAEHLAAVATASDHSGVYAEEHRGYADHGDIRYHGPTAIPHVLHDGHIADTHEVAVAKAEHLAAVAAASDHSGVYAEEHRGYSDHGDIRYHGPTAIPHVLHDGHIADTREVAAAKTEHLAAVAKAQSDGYNHGVHSEHSGTHRGYAHHVSYHGPIAKPHVLHTGYLADTHAVAAAKHHHYQALSAASHRPHDDYHHSY